MAMVSERRKSKDAARTARLEVKGSGPEGRKLERGEIVPLSAAESARLAELYADWSGFVLNLVRKRLARGGVSWAQAVTLAPDLAQAVWVAVARYDRGVLLAGEVDEETSRRYLATLARQQVGYFWRLRSSHEVVTDFDAPEWRAVEAAEPEPEAELTDRCDELLALLSPEVRAALVEVCYGVPVTALADTLGLSLSGARRLIEKAAATMRGELPAYRPPVPEDAPPARLEDLPAGQRAVLGNLNGRTRTMLLLRLAGHSPEVIARRGGWDRTTVYTQLKRYADVLTMDGGAGSETAELAEDVPALESLPAGQRAALEALNGRTRLVLLLRLAGVSVPVIAQRTGRDPSCVYKMVKRYARVLTADSVGVAA